MKIRPKTPAELDTMRAGAKILNQTLKMAYKAVEPGQTLLQIDQLIAKMITRAGATPAFLGYQGFPAASCLSVNSAIVHQIPSDYILKVGDILGIDIGIKFEGYYTDAALTMPVGNIEPKVKKLLAVTQTALKVAIESAIDGNQIKDIGMAIEKFVKSQGSFGIVRELAGHGIGQNLQELPEILNYSNRNNTPITDGMTLAIEPMICLGDATVVLDDDGWTVRAKNGSMAAQFETTIVISRNDPEILITFPLELAI